MAPGAVRPSAVAGSWYPADPEALRRELDAHLAHAGTLPSGDLRALIAPHAGLTYSGPVAAWSYKAAAAAAPFDAAIIVGPSHFVGFDGVAAYDGDAFETPLGPVQIRRDLVERLTRASPVVHLESRPHAREHSIEMQLPFVRHLLPGMPIVPLLMGWQVRATIEALADALAAVVRAPEAGRVLLVASTDLSHYFDARKAAQLDAVVIEALERFDVDGLLNEFEAYPEGERGRSMACGGGAAIAVLLASRALGASGARVLKYANSGDVSGDYSAVVGYLAAAIYSGSPAL